MEKISGCVEHTEALTELLLDAKRHGKQILTTWLDLQNAYGSVRHNLIQFALEWYHVPEHIVFNYYDEQFIRAKTKEWTTDWMQCLVGVFPMMPVIMHTLSSCLQLVPGLSGCTERRWIPPQLQH